MVKNFKKMAYKNFRKSKKFSRKDGNSNKNSFRKAGSKEGRSEKMDKSKITCYSCCKKGHFAHECKKEKLTKAKPTSQRRKTGLTLQTLRMR